MTYNDDEWILEMAKLEEEAGGFPGVTGVMIKKAKDKKRRPILLLDLDGVVNVLDKHKNVLEFHHKILQAKNAHGEQNAHWCSLAHGTIQKLKELAELYDVHWCSGWNEEANKLNKHLGMKDFSVCRVSFDLDYKSDPLFKGHWKLKDIAKFLENDTRPVAFIDDEIESIDFAIERSESIAPTLFVKTSDDIGLTESEMLALRQFAHYNAIATTKGGENSNEQTEE